MTALRVEGVRPLGATMSHNPERTGEGSDPLVQAESTVSPIYLDHNATTPVDAHVLEAMLPFLRGEFGNPSSAYALGRRAHEAIERARAEVAQLIGAAPRRSSSPAAPRSPPTWPSADPPPRGPTGPSS